ncbi:hypothetical protein F443_13998 [Phytophthora nicotianae P1569]|uniref:Uncharacterized protein n=1 Tax=Phytophthora nicotianae P1569 TaxID=1317065 RepID=V9EP50_PHYNI|nr:hypothetical protein F443_13998 [Phytophthora nicotianae P1569]
MSSSSSRDDSYDSYSSDDGYGSYDTTDELGLWHLFDSGDDYDDEEEIVDLGTFDSKKAAMLHANRAQNVKYRFLTNSTSTLRKTYQYRCSSHEDCESVIRIVVLNGRSECSMTMSGRHGDIVSNSPRQGIDKRIDDDVNAILVGSTGPKAKQRFGGKRAWSSEVVRTRR